MVLIWNMEWIQAIRDLLNISLIKNSAMFLLNILRGLEIVNTWIDCEEELNVVFNG